MTTKITTIPRGYRLTVVSWENDGDNYNTKQMEGLADIEVRFLVDFAKLFYSQSSYKNPKGYGNMYEPSELEIYQLQVAIQRVVSDHPLLILSDRLWRFFKPSDDGNDNDYFMDGAMDRAYELGLCGGDYYARVMESFKVEFIPEDIYITDVTENFK